MATVGSFEAKTHLSALLERVAKGERITITKHGVPAFDALIWSWPFGRSAPLALLDRALAKVARRVKLSDLAV